MFLGLSANLALVSIGGLVEFDLKPGFRESVQVETDSVFETGILTSGQQQNAEANLVGPLQGLVVDAVGAAKRLLCNANISTAALI